MGYFDEQKNVEGYVEMAEGYDGRNLIAVLERYLPAGATVLEMGMGPGKDLDILVESYTATGSDFSQLFLDMYRKNHPSADLLKLDAVTIETERRFDCIYSNKVLHHLPKSDLKKSFQQQRRVVGGRGLLLHSFWLGDKEEMMKGLRFVYYLEEELLKLVGPGFEVLETARYSELDEEDSFFILIRSIEP